MKQMNWIFASLLWLACGSIALAQTDHPGRIVLVAQTGMVVPQQAAEKDAATLDAQRENARYRSF
jgi:hypothetical protein